MKNKTVLIILSIFVIAIAYKIIFKTDKKGMEKNSSSSKPAGPARVGGIVIKGEKFGERISASGSVIANEEVDLNTEASGKITRLNFKEGSYVNKGELLLKINDADLQAQLEKQASTLKLAEERDARQKRLLDIKAISREEYDISQNQISGIKADMALIKAQIAKTEIRAPFSGKIGLKYVSDGSYISPTSKIALLQDADPVKIDFSIPEKYMHLISREDDISFKVAGQDNVYKAKIYAIESKVDQQTRSIQIRAICPNPNGELIPGSFASIDLKFKEIEDAILIPTESVIPDLKGQKVFITKNGKAFSQRIETGVRTDTKVQVKKGLEPGDTLITTGIVQLKPDMPVKVAVKN